MKFWNRKIGSYNVCSIYIKGGYERLVVTMFAQFILKDVIHRVTPGYVINIGKKYRLVYTLLYTTKL